MALRRITAPTSVKAAPARKTLDNGMPVFGNFSRVVVVVVDGDVVVVVLRVVVVVDDRVVVVVVACVVVDVDPGVVVDVDPDVVVVVDPGVVVVVDPGVVAQIPLVMVFVSRVTAPFRANNCPCTLAPVFAAMDVKAKICPTKLEFVPKVAELPTFQKIRQKRALLMRLTLLPAAVMSVEVVLNTKTPSGSPWASSVRVPVIWKVPLFEA